MTEQVKRETREIGVTVTKVPHTCRDEGYSPYIAPCRGCLSQLSLNSQAVFRAQRSRTALPRSRQS